MKTIYVLHDANGRIVEAKESPLKAREGLTSVQLDLPETANELMQNAAIISGPHKPGAPHPEFVRVWMRTKALVQGGGSPGSESMYKEVAAFLAALQEQPGWPNPPPSKPSGSGESGGPPHVGPSKPYVKPHKE